ncbi:hypothetical protein PDE_04134 [Penicillium oxalicum 114-2]|uniref:RNA polymerase II transcription factor SIII subunit A n=1 Tax=Penicillium oxalicum (strain 114-2 / CGMCC 5302) TaxID=933388 RepID=S7ZET9_PENO1|nr:hypothetical protein PDE_04134 [Penicillium oxalicum 114-2]
MPAPSLKHLATITAIKHVKSINDVGNLPYALVRPILMRVDNPEKLHAMELLSPYLAEADQEIWLELIKRDIPQWQTYDLPQQSNRWYDIYCDLQAEVQRELDADAAKLKMAIDGIKSERAQLQPKVMNSIPRGARSSRPRIMSRGLTISRPGTMSAPDARKKSAIFAPQRRNTALAVPTKHLNNRATQVKKAPLSLIEAHRRPAESPLPKRENGPGRMSVPGRTASGPSHAAAQSPSSSSLADREARLRAIASGKPIPPRPLPSSSSSGAGTDRSRTAGHSLSSAKEGLSPGKKITPKRKATSSPPQSTRASGPPTAAPGDTGSEPAARPALGRKRSEVDIFLRPKKKRIV